MTTLFIHHDAFLDHVTPPGHPERVDRLRAIAKVIEGDRFSGLVREVAPRVPIETALLAHPEHHVRHVESSAPTSGWFQIDADTIMSTGTLEATERAMGAATRAVDAVMTGEADNAFVASRPPGHHAERERAMGFCFFNNAAIAAFHATKVHGAERVAIVDFDVHHGNGTQDIFWDKPDFFYASTHQMPLYPGTGAADERGKDDAGNIVNAPLAPGDGRPQFEDALEDRILPALSKFSPDMLIISAGFDAHTRDPLANIELVEEDFAWATRRLIDVAGETAGNRVVSLLEGGYDLQGLSLSVGAHVERLMTG